MLTFELCFIIHPSLVPLRLPTLRTTSIYFGRKSIIWILFLLWYDILHHIIWYKLQMYQTDFQYTKLFSKTKCLFEVWLFCQLPWFKEAVTIDTTVYLRIHDGYQKTVSSEMDSRDITNCLISWKLYHILVFPPFFYIYIDSVHENVIYVSLKSDIYRLVDRNLFLCIYLIK